jgi:hypothetical protein
MIPRSGRSRNKSFTSRRIARARRVARGDVNARELHQRERRDPRGRCGELGPAKLDARDVFVKSAPVACPLRNPRTCCQREGADRSAHRGECLLAEFARQLLGPAQLGAVKRVQRQLRHRWRPAGDVIDAAGVSNSPGENLLGPAIISRQDMRKAEHDYRDGTPRAPARLARDDEFRVRARLGYAGRAHDSAQQGDPRRSRHRP